MASSKPTLGVNDLQSQFPEIAAEAYGWDPTTVFAKSGKKLDWKCSSGHIYRSIVQSRTKNGNGCAICGGQKTLPGFNDLNTKFPEIAAEAYGWDPSTVVAKTNKKKDWKCKEGHIYHSSVSGRTNGRGCPICSGLQVLAGFNDLQTKFPDIAAETHGWDPVTVSAGTHQKKDWKCKEGHIYSSTVKSRTSRGSGCPICAGLKVLAGFNDLQTKFPNIAAEAFGWDPLTVTSKALKRRMWRCSLGHIYEALVSNRSNGKGCPFCVGKKVLSGFNDLKTMFPEIAGEAYGWDPTTVVAGSKQKLQWICSYGHIWEAVVYSRRRCGCPICSSHQFLVGVNDLNTKFPDIAAQAHGWDPTSLTAGSNLKRKWKCSFGHIWDAVITSRTVTGSGCPECAQFGFNPGKDAWFYLMQRPGEQQFGITNNLPRRMTVHENNGWNLIEHTTEPALGQKVLDIETAFKKWLKKEIGLMEGTTENWSTTKMEVHSLAELKARSGIETDLF